MRADRCDVVILGAGLAGLSLARQLLMYTDKRIFLLEKQSKVPAARQKVGEATVQVSGYYLAKILDLEEHLFQSHLMKYNLRFLWPTPGREKDSYEHYSQSYIRQFSNIASFQLDRNRLEEELLRLNLESDRFDFQPGVAALDVSIGSSGEPHQIRYQVGDQNLTVKATWLVDATGRAKFLARKLGLARPSPIRHGSTFFWVEGLVDLERLTSLSHPQRLAHPSRHKLGHLPAWLATNHFMGEGVWFWTIPLRGKTSLGLVYDRSKVSPNDVSSPAKVIAWVCDRFPLLARDLPKRKILDQGSYRDFSYDCVQAISADRWALAGEACRFTDPLYSPGGDLIALHNTLITDAILAADQTSLAIKARLYEPLLWAFYEAYVPGYAVSYEVLGDQECFTMKYGWELTVYFTFYVFPFINRVFTEPAFVVTFLGLFAELGTINKKLQPFITAFYRWKKGQSPQSHPLVLFDLTAFEPLKKAEELFYQVGLTPQECVRVLKRQMANIEKMVRFIIAYVYASVLGDARFLTATHLVEKLEIGELEFDPEKMRKMAENLDLPSPARASRSSNDFVAQFWQAGK